VLPEGERNVDTLAMLYSDRPISSPRQDVLGRAGFALELAKAIDNLVLARDGFVIALLGEWGSGKSSVIELIVRYQLAALLKTAIGVDGHGFLEKIVQYPKHLPPIDETDLSNLLDADLEMLFTELTLEEKRRLATVEERVNKFPEKDNAHLRRLFIDFLSAALRDRRLFDAEWFYHLMAISPAYISHRERKPGSLFEDDGFLPLNLLLYQVLRQRFPEERYQIVAEKIDQIEDVSVLTDFFRSTLGDTIPEGARKDKRNLSFFGEGTEELREHLVNLVRDFAKSGKLWHQVSPSRLLWFWWGSDHADEVRGFLSQSILYPASLRELLAIVIGTVVSSSGNYERVSSGYEKLVDFDELKAAALDLVNRYPDKETVALVDRFIEALKNSEDRPF
jgi:hypothetical protein